MQIAIAIADEAHYRKNPDAARTKSLTPVLCRCKHVLLLTGTPALAKPRELFSLLSILRPDVFSVFKHFGDRYCDPQPSPYFKGLNYDGCSNSKELHFILKKGMMIRRLKKDVLKELPAKRRQKIHISADPAKVKEIQKILEKVGSTSIDQLFDEVMRNSSVSSGERPSDLESINTGGFE